MTNQESINAFLIEKFLGGCWHDYGKDDIYDDRTGQCPKCGEFAFGKNQNLFTPDGFFLLWNKAQEQEWWEDFVKVEDIGSVHRFMHDDDPYYRICLSVINPQTFPILLAEYLGWKEAEQ